MKAPFPWFGGKSRVAHLVWDRIGNVPNYVEPFFGSGAVLLERPWPAETESVNDLDCMVANFWRALQHEPDAVAGYADNPVNEADQHARHLWLCSAEEFRERMKTEPEYYDDRFAYHALRNQWEHAIHYTLSHSERDWLCGMAKAKQKMDVTIAVSHKKLYDTDNLYSGVKPILDSLKRLGLIHDDAPAYCDLICSQEQVNDKRTTITIEDAS